MHVDMKTSIECYQHDIAVHNWVVVSNMFYVHHYLGKISNLNNIFQGGWNHQLDNVEQ